MNLHERDKITLEKIEKNANLCIVYIKGMDLAKFSADDKTVNACVFCLSQIGELVGKLSDKFIKQHPAIEWHKIKGLRNRIVHDYEGLKLNMVWDVLTEFLPTLIKYLKTV